MPALGPVNGNSSATLTVCDAAAEGCDADDEVAPGCGPCATGGGAVTVEHADKPPAISKAATP